MYFTTENLFLVLAFIAAEVERLALDNEAARRVRHCVSQLAVAETLVPECKTREQAWYQMVVKEDDVLLPRNERFKEEFVLLSQFEQELAVMSVYSSLYEVNAHVGSFVLNEKSELFYVSNGSANGAHLRRDAEKRGEGYVGPVPVLKEGWYCQSEMFPAPAGFHRVDVPYGHSTKFAAVKKAAENQYAWFWA